MMMIKKKILKMYYYKFNKENKNRFNYLMTLTHYHRNCQIIDAYFSKQLFLLFELFPKNCIKNICESESSSIYSLKKLKNYNKNHVTFRIRKNMEEYILNKKLYKFNYNGIEILKIKEIYINLFSKSVIE